MKHTLIILVLSAFIFTVGAKTIINKTDVTKLTVFKHNNVFHATELSVQGSNVQFSGLPKSNAAIRIIDDNGKVAMSGTLSRDNNTIDQRQLPNGRYTIVLKQGSSVKMFGYYTDIVITGTRM